MERMENENENRIICGLMPKFDTQSFVHIIKQSFSGALVPGNLYTFLEYPYEYHITRRLCVAVEVFPLEEIPEHLCVLDENCEKSRFIEIAISRYGINRHTEMQVGYFTYPQNILTPRPEKPEQINIKPNLQPSKNPQVCINL